MPQAKHPLNIQMRGVGTCCAENWLEAVPEARDTAVGARIECPDCGGVLIARDGVWQDENFRLDEPGR